MPLCPDGGRWTIPDESGVCDACLGREWSELRRRKTPVAAGRAT